MGTEGSAAGGSEQMRCESKEAEDEQGGQDMRNLWHQTQLREKKNKQTYAVCAVHPEAPALCNIGGMCVEISTAGYTNLCFA